MDIGLLIEGLRQPQAYPYPVDSVDVVQTHISAVFLAGELAYKVKKPVDFGFLDFTTLDRRQHFCAEEVRLNRRLAPGVYVDVVPIVAADGFLRMGGAGEALEYAVRMVRLPEDRKFAALLARGELTADHLTAVAGRLAAFHQAAAGGPEVARWGGFETVARNVRENFDQVRDAVGDTVSRAVFDSLERRSEAELEALRPLIEGRARRGVPREGHGDLHLAHVYSFPDAPPPGDLVVVDCIEFNERFRYADPVADVAFLDMDLRYNARRDLAAAFTDAWFSASDDEEGRALLPFYCAYRAIVRGKVDGFAARGAEMPEADRERFRGRARGYFLLALGVLADADERPALIVVSGLPGTGKSAVTRWLTERGWTPVSTDVVRKSLAGLAPTASARAEPDAGIYTPEWTERTYAAVGDRAAEGLFSGRRVVVEGTFLDDARRRALLDLAAAWRVPALLLQVEAPAEVVRQRLAARRGDASDADWGTYEALRSRWQQPGAATAAGTRVIDNGGSLRTALDQVRAALAAEGLLRV